MTRRSRARHRRPQRPRGDTISAVTKAEAAAVDDPDVSEAERVRAIMLDDAARADYGAGLDMRTPVGMDTLHDVGYSLVRKSVDAILADGRLRITLSAGQESR